MDTNIFFAVMMTTNTILAVCNLINLYRSLNETPPAKVVLAQARVLEVMEVETINTA